jgi:hypothetical protein
LYILQTQAGRWYEPPVEEVVRFFANEWKVIWQAPVTFLVGWAILWGVGYFLAAWRFGKTIDNLQSENGTLRERVQLRDDRAAEYERKLDVDSPDEAKARLDALEQRLEKMGPRRLSEDQANTLVAKLAATPGKMQLQLAIGTSDGIRFESDFREVFTRAGWTIASHQIMGGMQSEHGLLVLYYRDTPQLRTLYEALNAAGLKYQVWDLSNQETDAQTGLLICPRALD